MDGIETGITDIQMTFVIRDTCGSGHVGACGSTTKDIHPTHVRRYKITKAVEGFQVNDAGFAGRGRKVDRIDRHPLRGTSSRPDKNDKRKSGQNG